MTEKRRRSLLLKGFGGMSLNIKASLGLGIQIFKPDLTFHKILVTIQKKKKRETVVHIQMAYYW